MAGEQATYADIKHLPADINAELLLTHDCGRKVQVRLDSTHNRNAVGDVASIAPTHDGGLLLHLTRSSLYDALPEQMFHSIDSFSALNESTDDDAFAKAVERQKRERENALQFFAPFDVLLLKLKTDVRQLIEKHVVHGNIVLQEIIGDCLTEEQRNNRFIKALLPFLPDCRHIRGNRTLLTLMLRKVLLDEYIKIDVTATVLNYHDSNPRYCYRLGDCLGDCFAGNDYASTAIVYSLHYWNDEMCDEHFLETMRELDEMRLFIQDWFLGLGQQLRFDVWTDNVAAMRLGDTEYLNYMGYNTSI